MTSADYNTLFWLTVWLLLPIATAIGILYTGSLSRRIADRNRAARIKLARVRTSLRDNWEE